jgi:hypothetical protein
MLMEMQRHQVNGTALEKIMGQRRDSNRRRRPSGNNKICTAEVLTITEFNNLGVAESPCRGVVNRWIFRALLRSSGINHQFVAAMRYLRDTEVPICVWLRVLLECLQG